MNRWITFASICTLAMAAAAVSAQAPGPQGPGASAPGMGMGPGGGMRHQGGRHHGGRWGPRHTMGWGMMTEAERTEHREKMRGMADHDGCMAYMAQHHEHMAARAKDKGMAMPAKPRRDACAGLPAAAAKK